MSAGARTRGRRLLAAGLSTWLHAAAAAQGVSVLPEAPVAVAWDLEDGTTVVLVEDHRAPVVELRLEFPAGLWSPWMRETHAEEAFRIQLYDPTGTLRARADRLAATLSLDVGARASVLSASFLREDLDAVRQLARDVLANRDFDRAELRRTKRQRQLAWTLSLKDPHFRRQQALARLLFEADDPRRRPYEKPEPMTTDLAALVRARDALIALPGRAVAFAGDLSREEAERVARDLLPPVRPPVGAVLEPDLAPLRPPLQRPGSTTLRLPRLTQVYFALGREAPGFGDPHYPAFLVADHVLGGHFYSRLYQALRHEGGETYGAGTTLDPDVAPMPYGLFTFTRSDNAAVTERKLREVLRVFHAGGITEGEREAALGFLRGRLPFARQTPGQVLERHLEERRLRLPAGFFDALVTRAEALDVEQVNAFVRRWYDPSAFSLVQVVPSKDEAISSRP